MNRKELLDQLDEIGIKYQLYQHPPIFTVADAQHFPKDIRDSLAGSIETKNLFLRDQKSKNYILLCLRGETRVKLKDLGRQMGIKGITFCGADELSEILGITPGSVCLFSLANDSRSLVKGFIDDSITSDALIQNHPLDNTATVILTREAISQFCQYHHHEISPINIPS